MKLLSLAATTGQQCGVQQAAASGADVHQCCLSRSSRSLSGTFELKRRMKAREVANVVPLLAAGLEVFVLHTLFSFSSEV